MSRATKELPNDVDELKRLVLSLQDQVELLRHRLFSRKSEKFSAEDLRQARLFDEIEAELEKGPELIAGAPETETTLVAGHRRARPGRRPLPESLPRREIIHDIDESEKVCGCGERLHRIGEETSEKLGYTPPQVFVERTVRPRYACRACEGSGDESRPAVRVAPAPPAIIPKSIATPGLLAHLITSKFVDAIPFYRMERILNRMGVELSRATMCSWALKLCERLEPLLDLMRERLLESSVVNVDETTVQVLGEAGRPNTSRSYMWAFRGAVLEKSVILFLYQRTRSAEFLPDFLDGMEGALVTDGYQPYERVAEELALIHACCWAHVRRKFFELLKLAPESPHANEAMNLIRALYRIEKKARLDQLPPEAVRKLRIRKSAPLLRRLLLLMRSARANAPPKSKLGEAAVYALNRWRQLVMFVTDGNIPIDNNLIENDIRPFVVGRKNWLFSGSPSGAHASAALYSIVATARANGLEPYAYLRFLFTELPFATTRDDFLRLAPFIVTSDDLDHFAE